MLLATDRVGAEPSAEQRAGAVVALVEVARVLAVQHLHPARQRALTCLKDEVVVRAEQAVRVHRPAVAGANSCEQGKERAVVVVVEEDQARAGAASRHVEDAVAERGSENASHPATLARV